MRRIGWPSKKLTSPKMAEEQIHSLLPDPCHRAKTTSFWNEMEQTAGPIIVVQPFLGSCAASMPRGRRMTLDRVANDAVALRSSDRTQ